MAHIVFTRSAADPRVSGSTHVITEKSDPVADVTDDSIVRVDHDLVHVDSIPSVMLERLREMIYRFPDVEFVVPAGLPARVRHYLGDPSVAADPEPESEPAADENENEKAPSTKGKAKS